MRTIHKLSARSVAAISAPGLHGDGGGLWLKVNPQGAKSWLFRFTLAGRSRAMGLGPLRLVSVTQARELAREAERLLRVGVDPIDKKRSEVAQRPQARTLAPAGAHGRAGTFAAVAAAYIKAHRDEWRSAKHAAQWEATLRDYALPEFGPWPVARVDTAAVHSVLLPIWSDKRETASRVRQRIEAVLDYAGTLGLRQGENPARWKGHMENLLGKRRKGSARHFAAMPWREVPAFFAELREQAGSAARALELAIVAGARTSEVLLAQRAEFDLAAGVWTIPAERMKGHRVHRVPLAPGLVRWLQELPEEEGGHVFPGGKAGRPLSNMAMLTVLRRMKRDGVTVHGFRSSFRDWAAENRYPRDLAELALAHAVKDATEAAYLRTDMVEQRAPMMAAWWRFCTGALS